MMQVQIAQQQYPYGSSSLKGVYVRRAVDRAASANSGSGSHQQLIQSRSVIDESIFVRFDSMDEDDGDEEEEEEVEYIGEEEENREIFSSLSCKTSQNNSYGGSCSSSSDIFGKGKEISCSILWMDTHIIALYRITVEMSRARELTSCMSVTSSELDSTSDHHHHQLQSHQLHQQHSPREAGTLPGRGSASFAPSSLSTSPFFEERSPPPAKGNPLGLVPNHVVTVPQDWMLKQVVHMMGESGQGTLWCPGCATVCGYWKQGALQLLGEFNLCDAFALQESCIRLKRRTRHKIL
eukprot:gene26379-34514_t